jgi:ribonuclease J
VLRLIPLGGLGEIGLNALVVEQDGKRLLIDAGLMFTNDAHLGVDIVVPDFSYLRENPAALSGIVLTHGHEDHIGALPFLLKDLPVPVYGTRFTLALVRNRLEQMGITADLREMEAGHAFGVGDAFHVEPLQVTHSIPDAVGFALKTREGTVIHTGDFKLDDNPVHGPLTDLARFQSLGEEGVLCLLSDSTNSESVEPTGSESAVAETFERLVRDATGRVLFSFFASNVHRAQIIVDLCARLGKKLAVSGRGMNRNIALGQELGLIKIPAGVLVPEEHAELLPDSQVVMLVTGTQGEPRSGLWQLTMNEHGAGIKRGDLVILSARAIPGNERAISKLVDALYAQGARVITYRTEPNVHVSGHASAPDQQRMLRACQPKHFVPIHGELRHLHRHVDVAHESGVANVQMLLARDGQTLVFEQGRGRFGPVVPTGRLFLDRVGHEPLDMDRLRQRESLARSGLVVAVVVLDASGHPLRAPMLRARGLSANEEKALPRVAEACGEFLRGLSPQLLRDDLFVQEEVSAFIRRGYKEAGMKKPAVMTVPVRR